MRDRTNISDALENHEENKNKDLSSTSCEFVSLECTPQVRYSTLLLPIKENRKNIAMLVYNGDEDVFE